MIYPWSSIPSKEVRLGCKSNKHVLNIRLLAHSTNGFRGDGTHGERMDQCNGLWGHWETGCIFKRTLAGGLGNIMGLGRWTLRVWKTPSGGVRDFVTGTGALPRARLSGYLGHHYEHIYPRWESEAMTFQFGYSEAYCSTFHTTQCLGLECPAVALSLTSILSSKGMVS